jgi:hypothetical protein
MVSDLQTKKGVLSPGVSTNLEEVDREHGAVVLDLGLPLALAIAHDLVDAHFLVPARHRQEVLEVGRVRIEREVRDAIFGRAPELNILLQVAERVGSRRRRRPKKARHWCGC